LIKKLNLMKVNSFTITLFIILFLGATVGYFMGDWALNATEFARPKDIVECRLVYPLGGIGVAFYPAVVVDSWVEKVFN